jgi:DNA-binding winged helix-turn-helix (wHTH) protein
VTDEQPPSVFWFDGFCLDPVRGHLLDPQGMVLNLRPKTFDVLRYLVENPDRIISRGELLEAVWPGVFVTDDSLTQCIAEVRRALAPGGASLLRTMPKRGYILASNVSQASAVNVVTPEAAHQAASHDPSTKQPTVPSIAGMERRLAAILAADIVGYSRLIGIDETNTFRRVMDLREKVLEPQVAEYGGRIVSYAGDGVLAEFPSVIRAVECALAVQRMAAEREQETPIDRRLVLRIGIHLGDILVHPSKELGGDAVNIAARLGLEQELLPNTR